MKPFSVLGTCLFVAAAALAVPALCGTEPVGAEAQPDGAAHATSTPTPHIRFATLVHDFGQRDAGKDLTTTFDFVNSGDDVLRIERVKGG
jgi:hypothetical protein